MAVICVSSTRKSTLITH